MGKPQALASDSSSFMQTSQYTFFFNLYWTLRGRAKPHKAHYWTNEQWKTAHSPTAACSPDSTHQTSCFCCSWAWGKDCCPKLLVLPSTIPFAAFPSDLPLNLYAPLATALEQFHCRKKKKVIKKIILAVLSSGSHTHGYASRAAASDQNCDLSAQSPCCQNSTFW